MQYFQNSFSIKIAKCMVQFVKNINFVLKY